MNGVLRWTTKKELISQCTVSFEHMVGVRSSQLAFHSRDPLLVLCFVNY